MSAPTASTDTNVSFASQPRHSAVSWRQPTRTRSTNNKRQPATQPKPSHPHTDRVFSPLLSISQSFPSSLVLSPLPDRSSRLLSYSANSDRSSTDAPYDHPIPADGGARSGKRERHKDTNAGGREKKYMELCLTRSCSSVFVCVSVPCW